MYSHRDFLVNKPGPFVEKCVMELMEKGDLLDKGHHLFTDQFYTKIPLALKLLERNTYLTGTINKNSQYLAPSLKTTILGAEQSCYFRHKDVLLVSYKQFTSRKPVFALTTACHAEDKLVKSKKGREFKKPILIDKYNQYMGGVDVSDKAVYHLSCSRQTTKYWKRIFYNLLDISLYNSYILYTLNTDKPIDRRSYYISIVESLAYTRDIAPSAGPSGDTPHLITIIPNKSNKLCPVCQRKATYWCPGCNCGVHKECFHKLDHFWRPLNAPKKRKIVHPQ